MVGRIVIDTKFGDKLDLMKVPSLFSDKFLACGGILNWLHEHSTHLAELGVGIHTRFC